VTRFLEKSFPSKPANGKYRSGWSRIWDGQITYICFECDHRWRGPKDSEAESCPEDGCPGYGEPLG